MDKNDAILQILEQDFALAGKGKQGNSWVVEWLLGEEMGAEEKKAAIMNRAGEVCKAIDNRTNAIKSHYQPLFLSESKKMLKGNKKTKSINLVTGTIGHKKINEKLVIVDMAKAVSWAYVNLTQRNYNNAISSLDMTKIKQRITVESNRRKSETGYNEWLELYNSIRLCANKINITPLTDHFHETGELPDGCALVPAEERFYSKPLTIAIAKG